MEEKKRNRFLIKGIPEKMGERLYLDGTELKSVCSYNLKHSARTPAELTITLLVIVDQDVSEQES